MTIMLGGHGFNQGNSNGEGTIYIYKHIGVQASFFFLLNVKVKL